MSRALLHCTVAASSTYTLPAVHMCRLMLIFWSFVLVEMNVLVLLSVTLVMCSTSVNALRCYMGDEDEHVETQCIGSCVIISTHNGQFTNITTHFLCQVGGLVGGVTVRVRLAIKRSWVRFPVGPLLS